MEHKKNFFLAVLWTLAITVACLISIGKVPDVAVVGKDKTVHAFFYLVFSVLWFLFLTKEMPQWNFAKKATLVILFAFFYGGIIEICQGMFTANRQADIFDVMANVAGSFLAILILMLVKKYRERNTIKNSMK